MLICRNSGVEKRCGLFSRKRCNCASVGASGSGAAERGSSTTSAMRLSVCQTNCGAVMASGAAAPERTAPSNCWRSRSPLIKDRNCASDNSLLRSTCTRNSREKRPSGPRRPGMAKTVSRTTSSGATTPMRCASAIMARSPIRFSSAPTATARRIASFGSKRLPIWRAIRDISRRAAICASSASMDMPPTVATAVSRPILRTTSSIPQTAKDRTSRTKSALATQVEARRRMKVIMGKVITATRRRAKVPMLAKPPSGG